MEDRFFLNGKVIVPKIRIFTRLLSNVYWGLGFVRLSRLVIGIGVAPNAPFIRIFRRKIFFGKRLALIQRMVKQNFVFDRVLKRMYKQNVDTLAKIGHYKGLCLKLNLPVHGQRTHTNASTAFKLNHNRLSADAQAIKVGVASHKFKKK